MTLDSCVFKENRASHGGAVFHKGDALTVTKSKFALNEARASDGGAIAVQSHRSLQIDESIFRGNKAKRNGGAIYEIGD
jgi:hypothetical protein